MKTGILLALTLATSAFADFSYTSSTKNPMGGGDTVIKHYYKGQKMMMEMPNNTTILDFDAGTRTVISHNAKTYSVTRIGDLGGIAKKGAEIDMQADIKETGQTRVINGFNTHEATMSVDSEVTMPGRGPMKTHMDMDLWIAKDVPGASELKAFYQRNAGAYADLMGAGAQKAMADAQRKVASLGGVPLLTVMKMKMPGMAASGMTDAQAAKMAEARAKMEAMIQQGGQQAEMAKQMLARMPGGSGASGGMEITTESSGFSSASIPDSVFAIPAGYQKVDRK
jgi:hypothetical protein